MYKLTWIGLLIRFAFCTVIVAGTFNPSGWSLIHWLLNFESGSLPGKIMVSLFMILLYAVYYIAVMNAVGRYGAYGILAFFGALIWQLTEWGWFDVDNLLLVQLTCMLVLAILMTIGVSWTQIRSQLTGQLDFNFDDD
ncbi:MAG: DUF6524 family protein [Myxococcales bacterium]|nr:DUF6524 family protein [Myxococcales bacterium]